MLTLLYFVNALLMIGLPLGLGAFLARRYRVSWRLYLIGAATFVLSQIGHIPFNQLVLVPLTKGWPQTAMLIAFSLSAGLFEEPARYLVYRFWIRRARAWHEAVMFGAGHGGGEAIIFGALALMGAINILVLQSVDVTTLGMTPQQLEAARTGLQAALSVPWYMTLLGAVERVWAMIFHMSAAVLVLQVFHRRNILWLLAAILWHTVLNAVALLVATSAGPLWSEAALGGLALISLVILYLLRDPPVPEGAAAPPPEPLPAPVTGPLEPAPLTDEALKETRYQ
jgi:uncharacterized membrane protein YhfC